MISALRGSRDSGSMSATVVSLRTGTSVFSAFCTFSARAASNGHTSAARRTDLRVRPLFLITAIAHASNTERVERQRGAMGERHDAKATGRAR